MNRPHCKECGCQISFQSRTGHCSPCASRKRRNPNKGPAKYSKGLKCCDCGKPVINACKTGRCHACWLRCHNADPEFNKKKGEGLRRLYRDNPEALAKRQKIINRNRDKALADPETFARYQEHGWKYASNLTTPQAVAKRREAMRFVGAKISAKRLAWCPEEMRPEYRDMIRRHVPMVEARPVIMAKWDELRAARHPYFSDVIHFMRRFTSVSDRIGQGETVKRYRVGLVDVSAGELLKRAEAKGYVYPQPDRLAA